MFAEKFTRTGLLGFNCQGDVGPLTLYTSARKKIVAFRKSPPLMPPTSIQAIQRGRFRAAALAWNCLSREDKSQWQNAARSARLQCTGFNLYVSWYVTKNDQVLATVEAQSGIKLRR